MYTEIIQAVRLAVGSIATRCSKLQKVLRDPGIIYEKTRMIVNGFCVEAYYRGFLTFIDDIITFLLYIFFDNFFIVG